ncbi:MAG: bifunctional metallophosphatase/5'-nucleotidase [Rhodospirillaceae bacterium]|jgi:5'-nucleotidase / UDP-sugar diphosphatase|nr:bifunctional metallophosphatase/5'-nucleotidase [Rhodospirillaceae bacterium]MBT5753102.1 bifunctional metallophosphatase/5'-nucleotidase [Rhodospirillaceae bacterium]
MKAKFFKRALPAILIALFLWPAFGRAETTRLTFLHVNDVYEISPVYGQGGLAELMTLLKRERSESKNTITTFGGDLISPSFLSSLTKGTQMVALMNAIGLDIAVAGNHEYDYGPEIATQRYSESKFPWLGANVLAKTGPDKGQPAGGLIATHIITSGGIKVGFFGLVVRKTSTSSSPGPDIEFAPIIKTAKKAVARLKKDGAELIVALTHLDYQTDIKLARSVQDIDLILGGHDHLPITFLEEGVLIIKSGHDAHYLAVVNLEIEKTQIDGKSHLRLFPSWRYIATAGVKPDPAIAKKVAGYNGLISRQMKTPLGRTLTALDAREAVVRLQESNFGDLAADAMRDSVKAEITLTNGGGIRNDRIIPAGSTLDGIAIHSAFPFGSKVVLVEISGGDLRAALENGVAKYPKLSGAFPQISGFSFTFDPKKPAGKRVVSVEVGGKPLDESRTYRLATNSYLLKGGNGYTSLAKGKIIIDAEEGKTIADTVSAYITAKKTIAPKVDGRIKVK